MTSPSLRFDAPRHEAELLRTPYTRSSQNTPQTNIRLCEVALLGHRPRSARHGSTGREVFHFGVHVSKNPLPQTPKNAFGFTRSSGALYPMMWAFLRRRSWAVWDGAQSKALEAYPQPA